MNHSCDPNVIVTYKGTVAEVRAVQEINPGDEVRHRYETVYIHNYEGTHSCCISLFCRSLTVT